MFKIYTEKAYMVLNPASLFLATSLDRLDNLSYSASQHILVHIIS